MDLGEWLKGLGLGQYEATLREHEIDADVLPDLTEADLEKIGLPLGARKRLMKGIAGLSSKESPPSAGAPAQPLKLQPELAFSRWTWPSAARSLSCSVISSARPASRRNSTPRTGAASSTPIWTMRRKP